MFVNEPGKTIARNVEKINKLRNKAKNENEQLWITILEKRTSFSGLSLYFTDLTFSADTHIQNHVFSLGLQYPTTVSPWGLPKDNSKQKQWEKDAHYKYLTCTTKELKTCFSKCYYKGLRNEPVQITLVKSLRQGYRLMQITL